MLSSKEFEFLDIKISKVNEKLYGIDRGGCGLFAVKLAKRLKKLGIPAKIAILDRWGNIDDYKEDIKELGYIDPDSSKPSHVLVKIGRRYVDNNGVFTKRQILDEWNAEPTLEIEVTQYEKAAATEYGWNPTFDRTAKNITIINSHLKEVCELLNKKLSGNKKRKPAPKRKK